MPNLTEIVADIQLVLNDNSAYPATVLTPKINDAVSAIAGGLSLPENHIKYPSMTTPFLPDLFTIGTVTTSADAAYVSMPDDFMARDKSLKLVVDSSGNRIPCSPGGDYHSFRLFIRCLPQKDLSETGSVRVCAVKGSSLYYQGKSEQTVTVHYYAAPTDMSAGTDEPDGLPSHLAKRLIRHWVCKEEFGQGIEDGEDNKGRAEQYHARKFNDVLTELIDYIGIDGEPVYFASGSSGFTDLGACD